MHDDAIVFHNHTAGERVDGAAAVRDHIAAIFARWPTLRFTRRALRVGDDFAVSEWTARATHPDDGRELEWDGIDVFPIAADGRIARKDIYSTSGTPRSASSTRPSAGSSAPRSRPSPTVHAGPSRPIAKAAVA